MNKKGQILIIGIVLVVVLIIAWFVFFNKPGDISKQQTIDEKVQLTGETKEFTIEAFQFGFKPDRIEVNQGDRVKITAYSTDVPHGLAINEFGVNMYLDGISEPETVEFIADKKGVFTFYCNIPCGRGHSGMNGQLIVK